MELPQRVRLLVDTASLVLFQYVCQGLFERHKLLAAVQLCAVVLRQRGELPQAKFEFLLRGPQVCVRACGVCVCALGGGGQSPSMASQHAHALAHPPTCRWLASPTRWPTGCPHLHGAQPWRCVSTLMTLGRCLRTWWHLHAGGGSGWS